ncbi:hypothetical protein K438DRAFT_2100085 [Mycena galopus ATCC 62051]|nr:hypothetical protein K438DRAFT_2100085 [Mycena galopus ATCC 62051]
MDGLCADTGLDFRAARGALSPSKAPTINSSSEFGSENCDPGVRPWTEVVTLFASPMTNVWSDGLAFSCFIGRTPIRDGHPLRRQHHRDH